jgi:hypothetical protein
MVTTPAKSADKREQVRSVAVHSGCGVCASAAGWVPMRCRECAAEAAVTARVCSACGGPIGRPPVVANTLAADVGVAAVSGAAGEAVPAGVVGQVLPEPWRPPL